MRTGRRFDFSFYLRALPLYLRNPVILVPLLLGEVVNLVLNLASAPATDPLGGAGSGLFGLIGSLIRGFLFGVAVIVADDAWRHGRANFDTSWNEARVKGGSILIAVLGFFFMLFVAQYIGSGLGGFVFLGLSLLVVFGLMYTIPAAAIGGVPGFAALSASVRTARSAPLQTILLVIVSVLVYAFVGNWILLSLPASIVSPWSDLIASLIRAILLGYVAIVAAKQYADLSFGRFW